MKFQMKQLKMLLLILKRICLLLGDKIQTWCENESVYAPDNIQTIYLSFTEINNNPLLELSFYLYGGTKEKSRTRVVLGV